jgi:hypothetical protein
MASVLEAAFEIQRFLASSGERFCFIGAIALQRWGEPRATRDVDLTVLCPLGEEAAVVDRLLAAYPARIDDARAFALKRRVLLLKNPAGVGIDVALGGLPFEQRCVARSSEWPVSGRPLRTCSAEDLLVLKAFAGRPQDWVDIANVVHRQGGHLDWRLVLEELEPLVELRGTPEVLERLRALKEKG